jgi:hypothetical protein
MNATHAAVGVSATSSVAMLTVLLTGFHGLDADHAAAAAWLTTTALGGAGMLAAWFVKWKWPSAPPLPLREQGDR